MNVSVCNLGPIRKAMFTLGELTIICGGNNTGKTYAVYAVYGFFDFIRNSFSCPVSRDVVSALESDGAVSISLREYAVKAQEYIDKASRQYSKSIYKVFSGREKLFELAEFYFQLNSLVDVEGAELEIGFGSLEKHMIDIRKVKGSEYIDVALVIDKAKEEMPPKFLIERVLGESIRGAVFSSSIPRPFIASAERTGSAIFQKELDFTRNRLVEFLGDKTSKLRPVQFLGKFSGEYPLAVRRNVDFIRELPNVINKESALVKECPDILDDFKVIIGGEYIVSKDGEVQYVPSSNKRIRLSLVESSSAVRSLLDIGFYLRHVAAKGDILMVDEPELNLHPENQRKIARLFARLVNYGVKVFITTHSDYIVKELNTLIMLKQDGDRFVEIANKERYRKGELLDANMVKVYIAEESLVMLDKAKRKTKCLTLTGVDVTQNEGIDARSFDETIVEMNRIQEEIVWGDE